MCDRVEVLIQSEDCFFQVFMKVAAECSIRPIWSTCAEGFRNPPPQAQSSFSVTTAPPPAALPCFFFSYSLLVWSVIWFSCCLCCCKLPVVVPHLSPHLPLPWTGFWRGCVWNVCVLLHPCLFASTFIIPHDVPNYFSMCHPLQECFKTCVNITRLHNKQLQISTQKLNT